MTLLDRFALEHVGIATASLDEASEVFARLGLERHGEDEVVAAVSTTVRCFRAGPVLIELVRPDDERSPLVAFLEEHGPGVHHIALRVDDLDAEARRLQNEGFAFHNAEPFAGRAGTRVSFVLPEPETGSMIELVEHPATPHAEPTPD